VKKFMIGLGFGMALGGMLVVLFSTLAASMG
jgi:hypothetical protein